MPKETYFNLPDEKRNLISDVAKKEFANFTYDQASVNRIVANAGISKGSLYQYFEDKKDIFLYILDLITKEKMNYISSVMANPYDHDIFTLIRELNVSGLQFVVDNPIYAEIGKKLMEIKNTAIYKEIMQESVPTANKFFEGLIEKSIAKGEIRADIDIKMFAYLITSMNTQVIEYYTEYVDDDYGEKLMETVEIFIDFLKNGISSKTK